MQMKSATLVHMLAQDLNQSFKLNSYEKYLQDYPEYKKLINVLGDHYLTKEKEIISFVVDENKLNELFGVDDFSEYIKQECLKFLTENFKKDLNKSSIFGNLKDIYEAWKKNGEPGYPPQLPIVIFFIVVARLWFTVTVRW